jgi:hypothetical protein
MMEILCGYVADGQAQSLQARFDASLASARALTNVEIKVLDTFWMKDSPLPNSPNASGFSRTYLYTYLASGRKYRAKAEPILASQTNILLACEVAFDGETFFSYDLNQRYLTIKGGNAPGDSSESPYNPLVAPFLFLTRQSDNCLNCVLRFTDIASPDFTKGFLLGSGLTNGNQVQIEFPGAALQKQVTRWIVFLDATGDSFTPYRMASIAGDVTTDFQLLNYTNLQGYQIPTAVAWTSSTRSGTSSPSLQCTGLVTVASLRVPQILADGVFQIDAKSAATVWDADRQAFRKNTWDLGVFQGGRKHARILLLSIMFIVASGPLIVLSRRLRKN